MYVRGVKKRKDGEVYGTYYQLVKSERVEGQPRTKVLLHLGEHPTVEEALESWPTQIARYAAIGRPKQASKLQAKYDRLKAIAGYGQDNDRHMFAGTGQHQRAAIAGHYQNPGEELQRRTSSDEAAKEGS